MTHISLNVPALYAAETYYCDLFGLEPAWRDTEDGTITEDSWEVLTARGAKPIVSLLWRDGFRLALSREKQPATAGTGQLIGHVGLQVSAKQLGEVRERALAQGVEVIADREGELFDFRDRYGTEWELDTRSFADPVGFGRQLAVRRRRATGKST